MAFLREVMENEFEFYNPDREFRLVRRHMKNIQRKLGVDLKHAFEELLEIGDEISNYKKLLNSEDYMEKYSEEVRKQHSKKFKKLENYWEEFMDIIPHKYYYD